MRGAVHRRVFEGSGVGDECSWDAACNVINEEQYTLTGSPPDLPSGESCSSCQKIFRQDMRDCQDSESMPRIPSLGEVSGTDPSTGMWSYYWLDHLGSTRGLFNASFTRVATYEYTPYGELYIEDEDGASTNRRYTGHTYDSFTGHYYAPYRYYAPTIARWLTRDPLGMVDGPNLYAYVGGNPANALDPLGLHVCIDLRTGKPVKCQCERKPCKRTKKGGNGTVDCMICCGDMQKKDLSKARDVRLKCCMAMCSTGGTIGKDGKKFYFYWLSFIPFG